MLELGRLRVVWREASRGLKAAPGTLPPSGLEFAAMQSEVDARVMDACSRLAGGSMSPRQWLEAFDAALLDGHTQAWYLGRRLAGDGSPLGEADRLTGRAAKDYDADFMQQFLEDIQDGRYTDGDGSLRQAAIEARARLYVGRIRGTANEAFVEAGPDDEEYDWVLVAEEHCDDCPRIAEEGPFTKNANLGYPGDGGTECLGNCKCYWRRRSDGVEGFKNDYGSDRS